MCQEPLALCQEPLALCQSKEYPLKKFWLLLLIAVFAVPWLPAQTPNTSWEQKIEPWLLDQEETAGEIEFLVVLSSQADLSEITNNSSLKDKKRLVFEKLVETAANSQKPILTFLESRGIEHQAFWVVNMIWVKGDWQHLKILAERTDTGHIYANPRVRLTLPEEANVPGILNVDAVEGNIQQIHASEVWAEGYTGQGVVIGGQDTGYDWDHPALKSQYRGWDGNAADHNYNWHDAIHSGSSSCGTDSDEPCDDHGHGTHTMGTMVGDDGAGHQIGVAPGARWIGCRNMADGVGTPATYTECYQWFMAPTDLNDENPDPDKAPHVINNSWSCPTSEGCTQPEILQQVVENVRAAGILTVHSAGNSGPGCSSVNTPAAIYEASFTVGAVDSSNNIASFSSRGSVNVDGSGRMKPDVVAPGVNIVSSLRGGGYGSMSGTSMAAPHVAGMAALLMSAYPAMIGDVDGLENLIEGTSYGIKAAVSCSGDDDQIPNNTFGWGLIDTWSAYQALVQRLELKKFTSQDLVEPGGELTYQLEVSYNQFFSRAHDLILRDEVPKWTNFLSSDTPFTLEDGILTWELEQLGHGETWTVNFTVRVDEDAAGKIDNDNYWVVSDEVPDGVSGSLVRTRLTRFRLFITPIYTINESGIGSNSKNSD